MNLWVKYKELLKEEDVIAQIKEHLADGRARCADSNAQSFFINGQDFPVDTWVLIRDERAIQKLEFTQNETIYYA